MDGVQGTLPATVYAGTKSAGVGTPETVERGIFKTGTTAQYFVVDGSTFRLVATPTSYSLDLTASETAWLADPTTYGDLVTGTTYHAPFNQDVSVSFTSLPATPGTITFHQITLTDAQVKESGALTSTAYEITSTMSDGSFTYNLTLPNPSQKTNVGVQYSEDGKTFTSAASVSAAPSIVTIPGLTHFTIFVVVDDGGSGYSDNGWNNYTSAGYNGDHHWVQPTQVDKIATWTFSGATGEYAILPSWVEWSDHATNAHYTSVNITGFDLTGVNQKLPANGNVTSLANGTWSGWYVTPGRFNLVNGDSVSLSVESSTNGNLVSDAMAFIGMNDIYVDDSWAGSLSGLDLGGGKIFGVNAFSTIGDAISAVSSGGTIHVMAGSYPENINISKSVNLRGFNADINPNNTSRVPEAIINGSITVNANNVSINGFTIHNESGTNGMLISSASNVTIANNILSGVGTALGGTIAIQAINVHSTSSNITIQNNSFSNIGNTTNTSSNKAIYVGDSNGGSSNNVTITGNIIDGVVANHAPWSTGGHGAYGILVNHQVTGLTVTDNAISNLDGLWAHAIGLEGDTPNAIVTGNTISNLTDHKLPSDAIGIQFEDNPSASTVSVNSNTFTNVAVNVQNTVSSTTVDARNNNWSVSDSNSLDQIEAIINQNCSNSPYVHGTCGIGDSSGYGFVRYTDIGTPAMLGLNIHSMSVTPNETPLDITCAGSTLYTNENSVALNWSSVAGSNIKYQREVVWPSNAVGYYDAGSATNTPFVAFGSSTGIEGLWKLSVRAYVDANGNNVPDGNEETSAWSNQCGIVLDHTAPTVSLTAPVISLLRGSVDIRGSVQDANPDHYYTVITNSTNHVVAGPGTVSDTNSFVNKLLFTWNTLGVSDGTYTIDLEARDAAGNKNAGSVTTKTVTVDNTAPTSVITFPTNEGSGSTVYTNSWTGSIQGTATDNLSGVTGVNISIENSAGQYFDGESFVDSEGEILLPATYNSEGGTWYYDGLTSPGEGSYTLKSHATDLAGNVENTYTLTVVYDHTIPEVALATSPASPDGGNGWFVTNPTITLTATDVNNIQTIQYQWDSEAGAWTTYTAPFLTPGEGGHVLYYRAEDLADNWSDTGIKNIRYDATELTNGPQNVSVSPNPTSGTTATVTWDAATDNVGIDHYVVEWKLGDTFHSASVGSDVRSYTIDQLTAEGDWNVKVIAFDGEGHSKDASVTLTVDRTAPAAPTLTLTGTAAGSATLGWTAVAGASAYTLWYGTAPGNYIYGANVGNVTTYTVNGLGAGTYYFVVRAKDGAGNSSGNSNEVGTGAIAGAAGVAPGAPAAGFLPAPQVLGAQTVATPSASPSPESMGSVLGATTNNYLQALINNWWFWPLVVLLAVLLSLVLYLWFRRSHRT